jgi:hypothetical protein
MFFLLVIFYIVTIIIISEKNEEIMFLRCSHHFWNDPQKLPKM